MGIADERSIAWGCAAAFRAFGADLAVTYLNDKAKKHVDPLARALESSIVMPLDVRVPGQMEEVFERITKESPDYPTAIVAVLRHEYNLTEQEVLRNRLLVAEQALVGVHRQSPREEEARQLARARKLLSELAKRPTNLVPAPTSFVGRVAELADLHQLFRQGFKLLTLLGPGGIPGHGAPPLFQAMTWRASSASSAPIAAKMIKPRRPLTKLSGNGRSSSGANSSMAPAAITVA